MFVWGIALNDIPFFEKVLEGYATNSKKQKLNVKYSVCQKTLKPTNFDHLAKGHLVLANAPSSKPKVGF